MKTKLLVLLSLLILGISSASFAQEEDGGDKEYSSKSLIPIKDDPALPRVLLIGDSISMGYTLQTREKLAGVANVHRPPTNCGSTNSGIQNLDKWLGSGKWDVIHFNWGMHDLKYFDSGRQNVPIEKYEKNLRELVSRLKATGATLIFATTTPLPNDTQGVFRRVGGEEKKYNEVAVMVMKDNGVEIDDLHAIAEPQITNILSKDGVHPNAEGCRVYSDAVAASISKALDDRKKAGLQK